NHLSGAASCPAHTAELKRVAAARANKPVRFAIATATPPPPAPSNKRKSSGAAPISQVLNSSISDLFASVPDFPS
ncbi:hypothetical protein KEM55_000191, partial [Ascosphaera atra]